MRTLALVLATVSVAACSPQGAKKTDATATVTQETQRAEIAASLEDSQKGWKDGDMKRFLNVYSDSADTIFVTDKGVAKGKAQMEANYREGYAFDDEARRGDLSAEVVDFRGVGPDHALTVIKYTLKPENAKSPPIVGYSTLLFRKEPGGWKVIADHSG